MANWGDDYSLLIHSIEGHLSEHIMTSPSADKSFTSNKSDSALKRRRLTTDDTSYVIQSEEDDQYSYPSRRASYQNADTMQLTAQLDESRLLNERLKERYDGVLSDFNKHKEKTSRQLSFMVTENDQLKKDSTAQSDRYYDEKKKWQASLRSLESELAKTGRRGTNITQSPAPVAVPAIHKSDVDRKLSELERSVHSKSNDMMILSASKAQLEEKCGKLQQDLLLAKLRIGEQLQADDDASETKDFKRRFVDLETNLRRKTRECDRLEGKVQNQLLLEEELATANMKLKLAQDSIEKFHNAAIQHQCLLDEKQVWSTLFRGIVAENDNLSQFGTISELKNKGYNSADLDVSPAVVLRSLGVVQKRYIVLLNTHSELEVTCGGLRDKLAIIDAELAKERLERDDAVFQMERVMSRFRLAQRQKKLFEGEVSSLRALLGSFDVEFGMGRPTNDKLFQMKDQVISNLQSELDVVRGESVALAEHADDLEVQLTAASASASKAHSTGTGTGTGAEAGIGGDANELQQSLLQEQILKEEIMALQSFSGVDFLPGKTKVLHLIANPSFDAMGSRSASSSSLPRERIKYLERTLRNLGGDREADSIDGPKTDRSVSISSGGAATSVTNSNTADSNKMNQRLKEMFKERITSFRECVYLLTGYKVDLYPADASGGAARCRLRSMYSDNPDDSLLFQMGDKLELMETPFASKLDSKLFAYLTTCNSVPAFLSSVTMELFDNQTFLA